MIYNNQMLNIILR